MYACIYCDPDFSCGCAIQSEVVQEVLADLKRQQKWNFRTQYTCFLAEFSLAELGGTPLSPLTEIHPAQKPLAEMGGTPPP